MLDSLRNSLAHLKKIQPLVLCLTNYVTMDLVANSLLALGAKPLMSECLEEIAELVAISQAVYINIGTLNSSFLERALLAAETAQHLNKPIILDPVGVGASQPRNTAANQLFPFAHLVKGNASEILALTHNDYKTKGVETSNSVKEATSSAQMLAKTHQKVIVITGPEDFITDEEKQYSLDFGSPLMPFITGMGCSLGGVISAFAACDPSYHQAAHHAVAYFNLCGQLTEKQTSSPGSFRTHFIDNLFQPDWNILTAMLQEAHYAL